MNNYDGLNDKIVSLVTSNSKYRLFDYLNKLSPEKSSYIRKTNLLAIAINYNSLNSIKILLDFGFDINKLDIHNNTPLVHVMVHGHINTMIYLIFRGAKMNFDKSRISYFRSNNVCRQTANLVKQFFSIDCINSIGVKRITRQSNVPIFRTFCKFSLACTVSIVNRFMIYKACEYDYCNCFQSWNKSRLS